MSLFRTAIVGGTIFLLLPGLDDGTHEGGTQRTTYAPISSSSNTFRSFCSTRPNICLSKSDLWATTKAKAYYAYTRGTELIWGHPSYRQPPSNATYRNASNPTYSHTYNTLTPAQQLGSRSSSVEYPVPSYSGSRGTRVPYYAPAQPPSVTGRVTALAGEAC